MVDKHVLIYICFKGGKGVLSKIAVERFENVKTMSEAFDKMLVDDTWAFLWTTAVMDYLIGKSCDYVAIEENVMTGYLVWVMQKHSQYRLILDYL